MKVVADIDIPFLCGVLEPYAEVVYAKGSEITPVLVQDADALLIRTRTKCNENFIGLLSSRLQFIASATIGTDHVDLEALKNQGIAFSNAPGCNAGGVMQYVLTALFATASRKNLELRGKTLGVIGVGNTGGRVAELARCLGFRVLRNDPPRAAKEGTGELNAISSDAFADDRFYSLETVLRNSDIVTMHVPLDSTTFGMASADFFDMMEDGAVFINCSRGEVVVDQALIERLEKFSALILDVWNGEPAAISPDLLAAADIATPHIAGYSIEGKINGTMMIVRALARHFGIKPLVDFKPPSEDLPLVELPSDLSGRDALARRLLSIFPVYELDAALRANPEAFEKIRSSYQLRHEFRYQ